MLDLLVFTTVTSAYSPKRLLKEGQKKGLNVKLASFKKLNYYISDKEIVVEDENGQKLDLSKAVVLRGIGEDPGFTSLRDYLLKCYKDKGGYILNENSLQKWSSLDKATQYFELQKQGVPVIDSLICSSKKSLRENIKTFGFPSIVKYSLSSRGYGVYKIDSKNDLEGVLFKGFHARNLILQRFLQGGQDLRVIVIGGQVIGAMTRKAKSGNYLTNYSQGGTVENYDITKDEKASLLAIKVADIFSLDYAGVDLMKNASGEWVVLEINRACQFKGFEKSTGINVAQKLIEFLST